MLAFFLFFSSGCCCFLSPSFKLFSFEDGHDKAPIYIESLDDPALEDARNMISSKIYKKLIIEVDYLKGAAPNAEALNTLKQQLKKYLDKPKGIQIIIDEEILWKKQITQDKDSQEIGQMYCNKVNNLKGDQTGIYVLYLPERPSTASYRVGITHLALAEDSTLPNFVIYKKSLSDWRGFFLPSSRFESYVLIHESCHLLQVPLSTSHIISSDQAHCCNPICVLQSHNRIDLLGVFLWRFFYSEQGLLPYDLCEDCMNDLEHIKNFIESLE